MHLTYRVGIATIALVGACSLASTLTSSGVEPPKGVSVTSSSPSSTNSCIFHSKIEPRRRWIEAELKGRTHLPWEGVFSDGGGFLTDGWIISSKAGYVSTGKVVDMGTVEAHEGHIKLLSESPRMTFLNNSKTLDLVIVRWGKRVYLVEPSMLIEFCNFANSGRGRQLGGPKGQFYLRSKDFETKVTGFPLVPSEFQNYVLKEPIIARIENHGSRMSEVIVQGQPNSFSGLLCTINAGRRTGVRLGMEFYHQFNKNIHASIYVVLLAETKSIVLISGSKGKMKKLYPIGTHISTQDPFYQD